MACALKKNKYKIELSQSDDTCCALSSFLKLGIVMTAKTCCNVFLVSSFVFTIEDDPITILCPSSSNNGPYANEIKDARTIIDRDSKHTKTQSCKMYRF